LFDFSETQDVGDTPDLLILHPTAGVVTFALDHPPRGFQVTGRMVAYGEPPQHTEGDHFPFILEPAPSALAAKINVVIAAGVADLEVRVTTGVSDRPSTLDVFENSTSSAPIATITNITAASATYTKLDVAALGGRTAPTQKV